MSGKMTGMLAIDQKGAAEIPALITAPTIRRPILKIQRVFG